MAQDYRMNLIEYTNCDEMMAQVAETLTGALEKALSERAVVSFAVPGGTTPGPLFDALARTDLEWSRVHVLLTDERWVPETDAQSNAALVRARLLTKAAANARFTPYYRAENTPVQAAQALSTELSALLPLDVLLLGMGADMHTASLFPKAEGLTEALVDTAPMFLPVAVAGQKIKRFTLTAPVLRNAQQTHLLIVGADKRAALLRASGLPEAQAPVQTVLKNATIHWSAE